MDAAILASQQEAHKSGAAQGGECHDGLDTFVRIARLKQITDSSKTTLWRWIRAGKFPRPIVKDGNTVLWSLRQVKAWQDAQLALSVYSEGVNK